MSSVNLKSLTEPLTESEEEATRNGPHPTFLPKGGPFDAPRSPTLGPQADHLNTKQKIIAALSNPVFDAKWGATLRARHSFVRDAAANAAEHARRAAEAQDGNMRIVEGPAEGGADNNGPSLTEAQKDSDRRVLEARALIASGYGKAASWNGTERESRVSEEIENARRTVEADKDPEAVEYAKKLLAMVKSAVKAEDNAYIAARAAMADDSGAAMPENVRWYMDSRLNLYRPFRDAEKENQK